MFLCINLQNNTFIYYFFSHNDRCQTRFLHTLAPKLLIYFSSNIFLYQLLDDDSKIRVIKFYLIFMTIYLQPDYLDYHVIFSNICAIKPLINH